MLQALGKHAQKAEDEANKRLQEGQLEAEEQVTMAERAQAEAQEQVAAQQRAAVTARRQVTAAQEAHSKAERLYHEQAKEVQDAVDRAAELVQQNSQLNKRMTAQKVQCLLVAQLAEHVQMIKQQPCCVCQSLLLMRYSSV